MRWSARKVSSTIAPVVLVAGALSVWLATRDAPSSGERDALVADAAASPSVVPAAVEPDRIDLDPAPAARRALDDAADAPVAPRAAATEIAATDEESVRVVGTVVVSDHEGVEHHGESGRIDVSCWSADEPRHHDVRVTQGRWGADFPRGSALQLGSIVLGGRAAFLANPHERVRVPDDGVLELRARWLSPTVLVVRDRATGADLSAVEVRMSVGSGSDDIRPGPDSELVLEVASSPIVLPPPAESWAPTRRTYHARSPGHAWGCIEIDHASGGERRLDLVAGGDLQIDLVSGAVPAGALLRLRSDGADRRPVVDLRCGDSRRFDLEGMRPDVYRASVELGHWWDEPVVLAEGSVEVFAGARALLALGVEPPPEARRVPLRGVVVVPPEWNVEHVRLFVELLDPPRDGGERIVRASVGRTPLEGTTDTFAWTVPEVVLGRYQIGTYQPRFSISREIGPEGASDVRVEIPPPAHVTIRAIDEATGGDARVDEIVWHPRWPQWVTGGLVESTARDPATGRFELVAPRGWIEVKVRGAEWDCDELSIHAGEQHGELPLFVRRTFGFALTLRDGDATVPWDGWPQGWKAVDGSGACTGSSFDGAQRRFVVTEPGTYRFRVADIEGFLPIPEQEVTVPPSGFVEHVVQLQRTP